MTSEDAKILHPVSVFSPERFFAEHVVPRKPALSASLPPDLANLPHLWTDAYLTSRAGSAEVQVEQRRHAAASFGKGEGSKVALTLRDALARMAGGDTSLYITTQPVPGASDGHPALYGATSPVALLAADIPLVPSLAASLVPQAINLWLGAAPDGSSSGLHCDYHDNLYVLLRGRKRFRLYPPSLAKRMYTVGRVAAVHANGRIVFKGQGGILPDGSEAGDAAAWQARQQAEAALAAAEAAAARGEPGAARQLAAAEARLDACLAAVLEADADDEWGGLDDFDAMAEAEAGNEAGTGIEPAAHLPAPAAAGDPASFSKVDLSLPELQLRRNFPRFPGKEAAMVCDVAAGQMLYLPAGWFHEVTSYSSSEAARPTQTHAALNYWFHPPDNLGSGSDRALRQPYRSGYWPAVGARRQAEYALRHRQAAEGDSRLPAVSLQQETALNAAAQAAGTASEDYKADRQADLRRRQRRARQAAAGGGLGLVLPGSYGLFGVGRRQHLHRFAEFAQPG